MDARVHEGPSSRAASLQVTDDEQAWVGHRLEAVKDLSGWGTFVWLVGENRFVGKPDLPEVLAFEPGLLDGSSVLGGYGELVHPQDRGAFVVALDGAMRPGAPEFRSVHRLLVTARGGAVRELWVSMVGRFDRSDAGEAVRMVGVACDVTAQRIDDQGQLRLQKLAAIATMTGGIAHDFNNVLGPILSYVQLAKGEVQAGDSPLESLAEIERAAARARGIVSRLLSYSRGSSPGQAQYKLCEVVAECCALMQPAAAGSRITLSSSCAAGLPSLFGDPTLMHQVAVNLVTNAIQAIGDRGGTIEAVVDEVALGSNRNGMLAELRPGTHLRLRVCDNGPGIDESIIDRLFDPFFTSKPPGQGTGIGLAAAQGAVRSHGGAITAENRTEGGATFTVFVPVDRRADGEGVPYEAPASPQAADGALPRVLFVDDEPVLTQLAQRALPSCGCSVQTCSNGEEALQLLAAEPGGYDALITDYSMPGLNGLQLSREARKRAPGLPIILTSGSLRPEELQTARKQGINAVMPKPCSMNDLANQVLALVGHQT